MDKKELREEIVYYFKKQYELGMLNTFEGNLSALCEEEGTVLITPTQQDKEKITPDMILEVDMDGKLLEESEFKPSSELGMHLEIYKLLLLHLWADPWQTTWLKALCIMAEIYRCAHMVVRGRMMYLRILKNSLLTVTRMFYFLLITVL